MSGQFFPGFFENNFRPYQPECLKCLKCTNTNVVKRNFNYYKKLNLKAGKKALNDHEQIIDEGKRKVKRDEGRKVKSWEEKKRWKDPSSHRFSIVLPKTPFFRPVGKITLLLRLWHPWGIPQRNFHSPGIHPR